MASPLVAALSELRDSLIAARLPLPLPHAAHRALAARDLAKQLDDYVLPRLQRIEAPLLTVVGGSTGAGKSTLVNSLIGRVVTRPGVIRPTTTSPVLVHHPDDARWFVDDRILPGLIRSQVSSNDTRSLQLVAEPTIPQGLAILDAPDIDSVVEGNRKLAAQLLSAADLWLFVTSAARYADAVPWEYLQAAVDRSAAVAVVVDRVPPAAMAEVPAHLGQMMTERGLAESPLFAVPETTVDADGMLPAAAVSPIRGWLAALAADQHTRARVVMQTLDGAVGSLLRQAPDIAQAVDDQVAVLDQLRQDADAAYAEAIRSVQVQTQDGTLLRGEVLGRWHDFVGTGDFFRAVEQRIGWLRDRIWAAVRGVPKGADKVEVAVGSGLEALLREEGEKAAERAEIAWRANPAGRALLEQAAGDLRRASADYPLRAARAIREWQGDVLDLVSDEGRGKRRQARIAAFGVNGVGVALMLVVFSQTGGLVGAEVGVAGGTAILAQRVLEAVFGEDAVRRLTTRTKQDLDARVEGLFSAELARFHAVLGTARVSAEQAGRIRSATDQVAQHRDRELHRLALQPQTEPALEAGPRPAPVTLQQVYDPAAEVVEAEVVERGE